MRFIRQNNPPPFRWHDTSEFLKSFEGYAVIGVDLIEVTPRANDQLRVWLTTRLRWYRRCRSSVARSTSTSLRVGGSLAG
jgi:hypothetical protein